jgi:hypothetical protein
MAERPCGRAVFTAIKNVVLARWRVTVLDSASGTPPGDWLVKLLVIAVIVSVWH